MDTYSVEVTLEGIFLLVPDSPIFVEQGKNWKKGVATKVDILMPNLLEGRAAPWKENGERPVRSEHAAMLITESSNLDLSKSYVDFVFSKWEPGSPSKKGKEYAVRILRRARVEVKADGAQPPVSVVAEPYPVDQQEPANEEEGKSLWWLPRFQEISPKFQWAQEKFRVDPNKDTPEELAAAFQISTGSLRVSGFNLNLDGRTKKPWTFGWPLSGLRVRKFFRVVGNRLAWRIDGNKASGNPFLITTITDGISTSWTFAPPAAGDTIEVRIANMELERELIPKWFHQTRNADPDFLEHYPLCRKPFLGKKGPVPMHEPGGPAGQVHDPCVPAASSGYK